MKRPHILIVLAALSVAATPSFSAAFDNGSFEQGTFTTTATDSGSGSPWQHLAENNTSLTSWAPNDVSWHCWSNMATSLAADGLCVIDLNGNRAGSIAQTFDVLPNKEYRLDWQSSRHYLLTTAAQYSVTIDQAATPISSTAITVPTSIRTDNPVAARWQPDSFSFVSNASSTTAALTFRAISPTGGLGAMIDDLKLVPIHQITTTVDPIDGSGGNVTCTASSVDDGGSVSCTVMTNPDFVFVGFGDACTGNTCDLVNVTQDQHVLAQFRATDTGPSGPSTTTAVPALSFFGLSLMGLLLAFSPTLVRRRKQYQ